MSDIEGMKSGIEHRENRNSVQSEDHMSDQKQEGSHHHRPHLNLHESTVKLSQICESSDGAFVYMDNKKFAKNDLIKAFGGFMNPGWAIPSTHKFGNPAPLGLSAFAYCTIVASFINCGARGLHNDKVNTGAALFYGGFIQLIAGLWEISLENAFGGLAFCSFGGYWMSSASINIPWFNIVGSYTSEEDLNKAMGFFYLGWLLFTIILLACSIKSTILFFLLFVLVFMRLLLLSIYRFYDMESAEVAAGVFGVLAALLAWYHAYAGLATEQNSYYVVNPVPMPVLSFKKKKEFSSDSESFEMGPSAV